MTKEKQNKLKILSKIIYIIAIIVKVVTLIVIPLIFISMVLIPLILNKVSVKDNNFIVDGNTIEIIESDKDVTLKYKSKTIAIEDNKDEIIEIKEILENNSKTYLIAYSEVMLVEGLIVLILMYLVLRNLERLFKNIHNNDTPFTLDNVNHIKKTSIYLTIILVITFIIEFISEIIFKRDINIRFSFISLFEILFLFSMTYIFEYGYKLQTKSKESIYQVNE